MDATTKQYVDARTTGIPAPVLANMSSIGVSNGVNTTINTWSGSSSADLTISSSAVTANTAGIYSVNASLGGTFTSSGAAGPTVNLFVWHNGSQVAFSGSSGYLSVASTSTYNCSAAAVVYLNVGDTVSVVGNVGATSGFSSASISAAQLTIGRVH